MHQHVGERGYLIEFLRLEAVIPAHTIPVGRETETERCVLAYEHYLREARGLAPATILNYVPFVRAFLEHRFGTGQVLLSALRANDVVGFVQHQAPEMNRKRAKLMTTALRSFLHHVRHCDEGMPDLVRPVNFNKQHCGLAAPVKRLIERLARE